MNRIVKLLPAAMVMAACVMSGCGTHLAPVRTPTPGVSDVGSMTGTVVSASARWPARPLKIFAAPFFGQDDRGVYVYEEDKHAGAALGPKGEFLLSGLKPRRYVLVAGPTAEEGVRLVGERGETKIFSIQPGKTVETGRLFLSTQ